MRHCPVSQDLEEIFSLSTRIAVLNEQIGAVHDAIDLSAEDVGLLMGGKTKTINPDKAFRLKQAYDQINAADKPSPWLSILSLLVAIIATLLIELDFHYPWL